MGFFHNLLLHLTPLVIFFSCNSQCLDSESDKEALLSLKSQMMLEQSNTLSNWNQLDPSPCNWTRVSCDIFDQRVENLDLSGLKLKGSISPYIGNLSSLRSLLLQNNQLTGNLPQQLGNLIRLEILNVSFNSISGFLPSNLSHCKGLRILDLMQNDISGGILEEISQLKDLQVLNLAQNHFSGEIPSSISNISSLNILNLGTNKLGGLIPNELAHLVNLKKLDLRINNLTGRIPNSIYNMSTLMELALASNNFWGEFPRNVGGTLPNLLEFDFCFNDLTGTIPGSLHNLTRINIIRVAHNHLDGYVPPGLENLLDLEVYNIGFNKISSSGENGLSFLDSLANSTRLSFLALDHNLFQGKIPESIGNLSDVLKKLFMGGNRIYGSIPSSISQLSDLDFLSLGYNSISGEIPSALGHLVKLQVLGLSRNHLSGQIPYSLGNLEKLNRIDLSENELVGNIPTSFGNFRNLLSMDLSKNKLHGSIPIEIFRLSSLSIFLNLSQNNLSGSLPEVSLLEGVVTINISDNHLSGNIPKSIGNCMSLEHLSLSKNMFSGQIPYTLGKVRGLESLDLSSNHLSGEVPFDLQNLHALLLLNLSFNNLEGEVPVDGIFLDPSRVHLEGNQNLCWEFKCGRKNRNVPRKLVLLITTISLAAMLVIFATVALLFRSRKGTAKAKAKIVGISESFGGQYQKISYDELCVATNGFNEQNLIGTGSFASVYKGYSSERKAIAIKVIDTEINGSWKSFLSECTALKHVRHRNVVKLITTCSIVNFRSAEFLALIFEFMSNGSLDDWITGKRRTGSGEGLNVLDRLNIAIDVASAVNYLHNECEFPMVHCDLKPSNILMDCDMTAKVGDFGLSRFLNKANDHQPCTSSTCTLKGSIGYIPPEYGAGMKASRAGDVYSFGIMLLELLTGRSPRHESFSEGLSLKKWVKMNFRTNMEELMDRDLLVLKNNTFSDDSQWINSEIQDDCLVKTMKVSLGCVAENPEKRLTMKNALYMLESIKNALLMSNISKEAAMDGEELTLSMNA